MTVCSLPPLSGKWNNKLLTFWNLCALHTQQRKFRCWTRIATRRRRARAIRERIVEFSFEIVVKFNNLSGGRWSGTRKVDVLTIYKAETSTTTARGETQMQIKRNEMLRSYMRALVGAVSPAAIKQNERTLTWTTTTHQPSHRPWHGDKTWNISTRTNLYGERYEKQQFRIPVIRFQCNFLIQTLAVRLNAFLPCMPTMHPCINITTHAEVAQDMFIPESRSLSFKHHIFVVSTEGYSVTMSAAIFDAAQLPQQKKLQYLQRFSPRSP